MLSQIKSVFYKFTCFHDFNMITRINESKTITEHISCDCKCKVDGRKCNLIKGGIRNCVDVSAKTQQKIKCVWKRLRLES